MHSADECRSEREVIRASNHLPLGSAEKHRGPSSREGVCPGECVMIVRFVAASSTSSTLSRAERSLFLSSAFVITVHQSQHYSWHTEEDSSCHAYLNSSLPAEARTDTRPFVGTGGRSLRPYRPPVQCVRPTHSSSSRPDEALTSWGSRLTSFPVTLWPWTSPCVSPPSRRTLRT